MKKHYKKNAFGAFVPNVLTTSLRSYMIEKDNCEYLILYMILSGRYLGKKNKSQAIDDLKKQFASHKNELSKTFVNFLEQDASHDLLKPETYEPFLTQMVFTRSIDNFETYLKDILSEVANKSPNILKSKDTETHEFILSFNEIKDLRQSIIDKKIEKLFFLGIKDINDFFKSRLDIDIFDEEDWGIFYELLHQRNIIVHNRGVITRDFAKKHPKYSENIGDSLVFTFAEISELNNAISNHLVELDFKIANKYNLELNENSITA
jgi:hypothetical protein